MALLPSKLRGGVAVWKILVAQVSEGGLQSCKMLFEWVEGVLIESVKRGSGMLLLKKCKVVTARDVYVCIA